MSVRSHAPHCAKTELLEEAERMGLSAATGKQPCTCGAEYEEGAVTDEEAKARVWAVSELGAAVRRMSGAMMAAAKMMRAGDAGACKVLSDALALEVGFQ